MKFVEHRVADRKIGLGEGINSLHRELVDELDARHGDTRLYGQDHRIHRILDGGEAADGRAHRFRDAIEPQARLGNHAERTFGADEQPRQIIARTQFCNG